MTQAIFIPLGGRKVTIWDSKEGLSPLRVGPTPHSSRSG
ncbi:hypothetical protein SBA2_520019 [Acidobacteriia bacterium SbA2]|nr:hypothetical protein SBA2_520019 [Acidobacteriia bacterium SbA2]